MHDINGTLLVSADVYVISFKIKYKYYIISQQADIRWYSNR